MNKYILVLAALLGAVGVAMGAFGAHGLEGKLSPTQLQTWDTAVKYQVWHVIAIFLVALFYQNNPAALLKTSALFFLVGVFLFSGSLYLLSMKELLNLGSFSKILGPITPLGGLCYSIGWVLFAIHFFKKAGH